MGRVEVNMGLANKTLIKECCEEVRWLSGVAAEIGVWQGDSAEAIAQATDCDVHLFDTFCGMPKGVAIPGLDYHQAGEFSDTSLEHVKQRMSRFGERVHYHAGVFPNTAVHIPVGLKFVHVDCDLYATTKAALEWAWPMLVVGGVLIDDDYNCGSCAGAKKAVDEFTAVTPGVLCERIGTRMVLRRHV